MLLIGSCIARPSAAITPTQTSSSTNKSAQLAIIIDDIGYNLRLGQRTLNLPGNITIAVLPFTPHGSELAEYAHQQGKEVMLHIPMSNHHNYPLGPGGLVSGMQKAEFLTQLRQNIANIPHVSGANNHMGSQLTEEIEPMGWLMAELKVQQLYFVDSRTSVHTQALLQAQAIGLPSNRRDVFLDDHRNKQHIHEQLLKVLDKARQQGNAIAIGHPYPETLEVLEQLPALLKKYQVELVSASQLITPPAVRQPTGSCMAPPISLWPQIWAPVDPFEIPTDLWKY